MPVWLILTATALYTLALFAIAWFGDRRAQATERAPHPFVYALAIGVYCTSWTYFGAVGTAASSGWDYLPIYLGPVLVFILLPRLVRRIGDIAERESITSLSDFLSARYGKSRAVAALVTLGATAGALPYIALQLKSVSTSFRTLASGLPTEGAEISGEPMLVAAIAMSGFAILFGTRSSDTTRRNPGLMQVLAVESVLKLAVLLVLAAAALFAMNDLPLAALQAAAAPFGEAPTGGRFVTITLLSMAAILCLPRQFHVIVIERTDAREFATARWGFPVYLILTSLAVIPITVLGRASLGAQVPPDLFVLALPLAGGFDLFALLVFLGGISAAAGMIVVAAIALSTMITNDVLVPLLMRSGRLDTISGGAGTRLVNLRRVVILVLMLFAYLYAEVAASEALAPIGLLAFAAVAQFAPALLGAILWRDAKARGVLVGVGAGIAIWVHTLFLPAIIGAQTMSAVLPAWLHPQSLLGTDFGDPLTHGVVWSLATNVILFVAVSLRTPERLRDRLQAAIFQGGLRAPVSGPAPAGSPAAGISPDGLFELAARFLNPGAVTHAFEDVKARTGSRVTGDGPAPWPLIQRTERLLASALGASSARVVMSTAIGGSAASFDDVLAILTQGTQADRFDRHMLQSMLEHMSQGISVVDGDQRLVAWNSAYVELFDYPPELIRIGTPISELIAYNMGRGWLEDGDPNAEIGRRVRHMQEGSPHYYERPMHDGRYLRIIGSPMPGGGYVTTFTDITEDKRRERELVEAKEGLERRVQERTAELEDVARERDLARRDAESANASKTRFLAAASHDLLQPLNAARLFLGAIPTERRDPLVAKADRAIQSADGLIKGLLDISRLDHGNIEPQPVTVPLGPLLEDLVDEASAMAAIAGISIRVVPTRLAVHADPDFLQSILRNFISNARRYTSKGGVVVGARPRGDRVRVDVWDTGPGITEDKRQRLFDEFERFADADNIGIRGAGLGLSVARRLAGLMKAEITVRSVVGRGSLFALTLPRADLPVAGRPARDAAPELGPSPIGNLSVLCVDDDPAVRDGMAALLSAFGCRATVCAGAAEAIAAGARRRPDAVLADLALGGPEDGLDVISRLRTHGGAGLPAALLSADVDDAAASRAAAMDVTVLTKPVAPDEIRAFLQRIAEAARQPAD
jgi:PAS domain S-box-containing protein